jgi:K+-sensing histidine kinase KdpD
MQVKEAGQSAEKPSMTDISRPCPSPTTGHFSFVVSRATYLRYVSGNGQRAAVMGILQRISPVLVSLSLVFALTAILWQIKLSTDSSGDLTYFLLFPVILSAALYNGRIALLCAAVAMICADYFLQDPIYSLANDNLLEYGDLIVFALVATAGIKATRELLRPRLLTRHGDVARS